MNAERLHIMIGKYFDGELSDAEEKALRKKLLGLRGRDELAEEALAVMSYAGFDRQPIVGVNASMRMRLVRIVAAAAVAVVVLTFVFSLSFSHDMPAQCYAYIGGERVENRQVVMALMADQLDDMSVANEEVDRLISDDFDDIREALSQND